MFLSTSDVTIWHSRDKDPGALFPDITQLSNINNHARGLRIPYNYILFRVTLQYFIMSSNIFLSLSLSDTSLVAWCSADG